MGHSRYGKSALIASGWSRHRIAAAIAHQSGFGGGSSSRSRTGERLDRMANSYPHWLRPELGKQLEDGYQLTLDQHFLLALSAPQADLPRNMAGGMSGPTRIRPMSSLRRLIRSMKRAAFEGLPDGTGMRTFDPSAEISYWLRVGGHSVVSEDIDSLHRLHDRPFQHAFAQRDDFAISAMTPSLPRIITKREAKLENENLDPTAMINAVIEAHGGELLSFLTPVLLLVLWTAIMWLWMYATRIPAMQKAQINPDDARHPGTL